MIILITSLPEAFPGILAHGVLGRALEKKTWSLDIINLYDFGIGKHKKIDDTPYGGGCGMIIMPEVVSGAIESVLEKYKNVVFYYMSPRGELINQKKAQEIADCIIIEEKNICIICGRFEGIDQRVLDYFKVREISIGNYVISGGELAAMVVIDLVVRLLPEVLGDKNSIKEESFCSFDNLLEHTQYTKPSIWRDIEVPEVLLSGNHQKIKEWKQNNSFEITKERRLKNI